MGILQLFKSRDKPNKAENVVSNAPGFFFGSSASGKSVTVRSSIQMTTVYACVRVIAETVASLPLHVYETNDSGSMKAVKHPLYHILHDEPNTEMTSFIWRETTMAHLLLWGNAYSQIIRNARGQVIGLYPLLPENMHVDRDKDGYLIYTYTSTGGQTTVLNSEQVLHIPGLGFDGVMGYSPIALERNAVGLGIAAEEYGSKFFANGATPSGVLQHPNTVKDPSRLRESWNAAYGGSANSHRVAVLEEGMTFNPISIPNNEAQFLETRKFQVNEICRIFRVPPHMVGDLEHATFSNIEHQGIEFVVHTIRPWLTRIEQAMNKALLTKTEKNRYYTSFNVDGLLRGDYKSRMEGYAIARQNGWMSANDIRELENLNPLPSESGGDVYLVNGNMIAITPSIIADKQRELNMERADLEIEALRLQSKQLDRTQQIAIAQSEADLETVVLANAAAKTQAEITARANTIAEPTLQESSDIAMEQARLQLEQLRIQVEQLKLQLEQAQAQQEALLRGTEAINEGVDAGAEALEDQIDEMSDDELVSTFMGIETATEDETSDTDTAESPAEEDDGQEPAVEEADTDNEEVTSSE